MKDASVVPLGALKRFFFYRDTVGTIQALSAAQHTRRGIKALFHNDIEELRRLWPDNRSNDGWNAIHASDSLMCIAGLAGTAIPRELGFKIIGSRRNHIRRLPASSARDIQADAP
jgi:hypothetical protein